jgi:hypothetical protein
MGWAFYSGDIANTGTVLGGIVGLQDGFVAASDYTKLEYALYYTLTGYAQADITGDGIVESADYVLMENNLYYTAIVIHP